MTRERPASTTAAARVRTWPRPRNARPPSGPERRATAPPVEHSSETAAPPRFARERLETRAPARGPVQSGRAPLAHRRRVGDQPARDRRRREEGAVAGGRVQAAHDAAVLRGHRLAGVHLRALGLRGRRAIGDR